MSNKVDKILMQWNEWILDDLNSSEPLDYDYYVQHVNGYVHEALGDYPDAEDEKKINQWLNQLWPTICYHNELCL